MSDPGERELAFMRNGDSILTVTTTYSAGRQLVSLNAFGGHAVTCATLDYDDAKSVRDALTEWLDANAPKRPDPLAAKCEHCEWTFETDDALVYDIATAGHARSHKDGTR